MSDVKTYDPGQVIAVWNGIPISGYADGTMITVERDEAGFTKVTGAQGDTTRVRNRNTNGKVTLTLQQSAPCNDLMDAQAILDETTGTGIGPFLLKDLSGRSLYAAKSAWVQKRPAGGFGKELGDREWVLDTGPLDMFTGGNG